MARIARFKEVEGAQRERAHDDVECGYRILHGGGEGTLLQLDTYGSAERAIPGKVSQSIQMDKVAACELLDLILRAFAQLAERINNAEEKPPI